MLVVYKELSNLGSKSDASTHHFPEINDDQLTDAKNMFDNRSNDYYVASVYAKGCKYTSITRL